MTDKAFPTLGVVGAYSGLVLAERGFDEIHRVMDHLYPGIMTLGCAAMQERASAYLAATVDGLSAFGLKPDSEDWSAYAARALAVFGPTLTVAGPANVSDADVSAAFEEQRQRVERERAKGAGRA